MTTDDQEKAPVNLSRRVAEAGRQAEPLMLDIYRAAEIILDRLSKLRVLNIQGVLTLSEPAAKEMAELFGRAHKDPYHVQRDIRRMQALIAQLLPAEEQPSLVADTPSEEVEAPKDVGDEPAAVTEAAADTGTHLDSLRQLAADALAKLRSQREAAQAATPEPPSHTLAPHWGGVAAAAPTSLAIPTASAAERQDRTTRERRWRVSVNGAMMLESMWAKSDDEAVSHMRFRATSRADLKNAVRTDLTRIALHRVELPVEGGVPPAPRAEEVIRRLGLMDDANWLRLVTLAITAEYIQADQRAWFLDPRSTATADEVPTAPPPSLAERATSLVKRAVASAKPELLLAVCLSDETWTAEVQRVLIGLFHYRQKLREGKAIPADFAPLNEELRVLANELRLMNNMAGSSERWTNLVYSAFIAEVIDRRLYHMFNHKPLILEAHRNTAEMLRGILAPDVKIANTLLEACAAFYGTGWDTKVRFVFRMPDGKTPQPTLISGIRSIEETAISRNLDRGFLSRFIRELVEGFHAARTMGERFTEKYPDGMDKEARATYSTLGLADDHHWHRFIRALEQWGVLWPEEAKKYLEGVLV